VKPKQEGLCWKNAERQSLQKHSCIVAAKCRLCGK